MAAAQTSANVQASWAYPAHFYTVCLSRMFLGTARATVASPFTTPEVPMSSLKSRMYPLLIAAIGVLRRDRRELAHG